MRENVRWVGFVPFYFLFFFFALEAYVILDGICSLPHWRECFLMHFDKHTFSWKADCILFHGYFRMKNPLLTEQTPQLKLFLLLSSFLPAFRVNDFDILSGFSLKTLRWQGLLWDDTYHPLEAPPLSLDSLKRHLDSFKWGQQTSRLPAQDRFDTVEIGTVCGEKWKCDYAIAGLNSDFSKPIKNMFGCHVKRHAMPIEHLLISSLSFHCSSFSVEPCLKPQSLQSTLWWVVGGGCGNLCQH